MTVARLLRVARQRIRALCRSHQVDADLERELAFHLDALIREKTTSGLTLEAARAAARREFGNTVLVAELSRDQRRLGWWHDLRQDLGYGLRGLRRQPGFATVAILSLALVIGANAAVLRAIDLVMFEGLRLPDADRLVSITSVPLDNPSELHGAALAEAMAWRDRTDVFESFGVALPWESDFGTDGSGPPPERIAGLAVSRGWFDTIGVPPALGRVFNEDDDQRTAPDAATLVISDALWRRRFGADPRILGARIRLDQAFKTVIGVMPPEFRYQDRRVEYWLLQRSTPASRPSVQRFYGVIARLRPGITLARVTRDLEAVASNLAAEAPNVHGGWTVRVHTLHESLYGWTTAPLVTLQSAVIVVLLIACVNLAGLQLARGVSRRHEIGLRLALGAGRGRIVRQLFTESLLLVAMGGTGGLVLACVGLSGVAAALSPPAGSPQLLSLEADGRLVIGTMVVTVFAGLVAGLIPALLTSRSTLLTSERHGATTRTTSPRRRSWLVTAQIGLAVVLVVTAGLLVNSLLRLVSRDLGFDPKGLTTFDLHIPVLRYARQLPSDDGVPFVQMRPAPSTTIRRFYEELRRLPGVASAAGISHHPLDTPHLPTPQVTLASRTGEVLTPNAFLVTPGFFSTVRATLIGGREIIDRDTYSSPWVVVVNETAARLYWPGRDAIGQHLTFASGPDERPREVVGTVRDLALRTRQTAAEPVVYASYLQQPERYRGRFVGMFGRMTFVVRSTGDPQVVVREAQYATGRVDGNRALTNVDINGDRFGWPVREFRRYVISLSVFAALALLLTAIGIYGVIAFDVAERTREIAIRRAIGAHTRDIVSLVWRQAFPMVMGGIGLGLLGALGLAGWLRSQLWGVTPTDPATLAAVVATVTVVSAAACVPPIRRALAVDPRISLASE